MKTNKVNKTKIKEFLKSDTYNRGNGYGYGNGNGRIKINGYNIVNMDIIKYRFF